MKLRGGFLDMIDRRMVFMCILEIIAAILCIVVSIHVLGDADIVRYSDMANYYANISQSYTENNNN